MTRLGLYTMDESSLLLSVSTHTRVRKHIVGSTFGKGRIAIVNVLLYAFSRQCGLAGPFFRDPIVRRQLTTALHILPHTGSATLGQTSDKHRIRDFDWFGTVPFPRNGILGWTDGVARKHAHASSLLLLLFHYNLSSFVGQRLQGSRHQPTGVHYYRSGIFAPRSINHYLKERNVEQKTNDNRVGASEQRPAGPCHHHDKYKYSSLIHTKP